MVDTPVPKYILLYSLVEFLLSAVTFVASMGRTERESCHKVRMEAGRETFPSPLSLPPSPPPLHAAGDRLQMRVGQKPLWQYSPPPPNHCPPLQEEEEEEKSVKRGVRGWGEVMCGPPPGCTTPLYSSKGGISPRVQIFFCFKARSLYCAIKQI